MQENFDRSFDLLMRIEGVYSNDPDDRGGKTLYGITEKNFPKEFYEINQIKTPEHRREYAKDFYKKEFWDKCECDDLVDKLDTAVFQASVNLGIARAKRMLALSNNWQSFLLYQIKFYAEIGKGTNLKFLRGWILRVIRIFEELE